MEQLRKGFFTNGFFSLGDDGGDIDLKRFSKDSDELAKIVDKISVKYDDHLPIFYTGKIYSLFRNFERVNRSEHGRGANEFNNFFGKS